MVATAQPTSEQVISEACARICATAVSRGAFVEEIAERNIPGKIREALARGLTPEAIEKEVLMVLGVTGSGAPAHRPLRVGATIGGGSPYYVKEDMSPWQENALRHWEDAHN